MNSTELSKYIWQLRDSKKDFNIKCTIICRARPYSNITKRCDLCTTEKLIYIYIYTKIKVWCEGEERSIPLQVERKVKVKVNTQGKDQL